MRPTIGATLAALLAFSLAACTDNSPGSEEKSPTLSASPSLDSGETVKGAPIMSLSCKPIGVRQTAHLFSRSSVEPIPVSDIETLRVCQYERWREPFSVAAGDDAFDALAHALTLHSNHQPVPCPLPLDPPVPTVILAATSDRDFLLRVPTGICESEKPQIGSALKLAHDGMVGPSTTATAEISVGLRGLPISAMACSSAPSPVVDPLQPITGRVVGYRICLPNHDQRGVSNRPSGYAGHEAFRQQGPWPTGRTTPSVCFSSRAGNPGATVTSNRSTGDRATNA